ncbi:MAG: hypothetical protein QY326_02710 [Bdellovibrionota bacterium]|nr:MAG: hypothetical protein QY326_02710 [Bdellovibrionota bacterium]
MKEHPLRRTTLTITLTDSTAQERHKVNDKSRQKRSELLNCSEAAVLVLNASREMATQMTMEITARLPGCSIMYAPSIALAKLIVARRRIDLVVSSPVLPDGGVQRLREALDTLPNPPDLVVVGDRASVLPLVGNPSRYQLAATRPLAAPSNPKQQLLDFERRGHPFQETIKSLGADLRNDLNNPLQAIVAMVFVAKAASGASSTTLEALEAIDDAAKNMARVVKGIEGKILGAITTRDPA